MAEYKPKQDDRMGGDAPAKGPTPSPETKPHGDKLQNALDAITDALDEPEQQRKKPH